jgi:type VI secretion system protein
MILTLTGPRGSGDRDTRTLRNGTLSIGRAPGNDWVLADPDRQLSKTHCMIVGAGGRYVLTDVSTNGVFINGASERVPRNGQVELTDGDEISLGGYTITLSEEASGAAAMHAPLAPPAVPGGNPGADPGELSPDPFADDPFNAPPPAGFVHPIAARPRAASRASDPFDLADEVNRSPHHDPDADFFRGVTPSEQWQGPSQADNADAPAHVFAAPNPVPVTNFEELDIDALLGDTPPGQAPAQPAPEPGPAAPAIHRPPPGRPSDIDALLGDVPPAAPAPSDRSAVPRSRRQPQPAHVAPPPAPVLPQGDGQLLGDPFGEPPPALAPRPEPSPEPPPAHNAAAASIATSSGPDAARLIAAFLDGVGLADLKLGADPEGAMRAAGALFRTLVEGLRQVLISRAAIKNEFRVEQTMLRARDNNVLKFAVTTEDALTALLQANRPGYQEPLKAVQEAFEDVRGHELAVMAGLQTALMALLRRFEPGALEKRLMPGMLDNLLPAARKARTWELFCATYKDIARDAEGDFQSVFGREFARAYDEQVRNL